MLDIFASLPIIEYARIDDVLILDTPIYPDIIEAASIVDVPIYPVVIDDTAMLDTIRFAVSTSDTLIDCKFTVENHAVKLLICVVVIALFTLREFTVAD
jgi:hypothetical protein